MRYLLPASLSLLFILNLGFTQEQRPIVQFPPETTLSIGKYEENAGRNSESVKGKDTLVNSLTQQQGEAMVAFAKTLLGTPYLYASTDPTKGFDCSGFVNYVAKHFNLNVPRSSVDFTDLGNAVEKSLARPGDFILFTGTDTTNRRVGHMGIVSSNVDGQLQFIHSSSGKANGVTISSLEGYYSTRFVKIIRFGV